MNHATIIGITLMGTGLAMIAFAAIYRNRMDTLLAVAIVTVLLTVLIMYALHKPHKSVE